MIDYDLSLYRAEIAAQAQEDDGADDYLLWSPLAVRIPQADELIVSGYLSARSESGSARAFGVMALSHDGELATDDAAHRWFESRGENRLYRFVKNYLRTQEPLFEVDLGLPAEAPDADFKVVAADDLTDRNDEDESVRR